MDTEQRISTLEKEVAELKKQVAQLNYKNVAKSSKEDSETGGKTATVGDKGKVKLLKPENKIRGRL